MEDTKHKNSLTIKQIEIGRSVTIQKGNNTWIKTELRETSDINYDSLESLLEAEQALFDHIESSLDRQLKRETKRLPSIKPFNLEKILWEPKQGQSGPFERSVDRDNPEFQNVVNALVHQRSVTIDGWYVWLFKDNTTLGRKPTKKDYC
jgi:hypothetical protein